MVEWIIVLTSLVPVLFFPRTFMNGFNLPQTLALGSLSTLGMVAGVAGGVIPASYPATLAFLFLIYMTLACLWTFPIHNARKEYGLQAPLVILFFLSCVGLNERTVTYFAVGVSLVAAFNAAYGIGQTLGFDYFFPNSIKAGGDLNNAIGSIGNPNFLASFICGVVWWVFFASVSVSWFFLIVLVGVLYLLYKTASRAGQLGIIGSLTFFILCSSLFEKLPMSSEANWLVFSLGLDLVVLSVFAFGILLWKNWKTFFFKEIDPKGKQVWYASFRYRLCYWWAALDLIKRKPLFGWGLWSFRREVYDAQARIHNKYPWFLSPDRYLTPQPRECHNDYLEHLVEYGIVGTTIFLAFVASVYCVGFSTLANLSGEKFVLMLSLLSGLTALAIDAFFFFALRLPSTGIMFWVTCAAILAMGGQAEAEVISFNAPWWAVISVALFGGVFVWECIGKRALSSHFFLRAKDAKLGEVVRATSFSKALKYAPYDTILHTHATVALLQQENNEIAAIHAMKMVEFYDGMTPWHVTLFNMALTRARCRNIFDESNLYLKRSHYVLPFFGPTNELLSSPTGVDVRSKYRGGRAPMKITDEATLWKIKAMIIEKENNALKGQILTREGENLALKDQLLETNIQNVLLVEKRRLNVPDNWIYNAQEGKFMNPAEPQSGATSILSARVAGAGIDAAIPQ